MLKKDEIVFEILQIQDLSNTIKCVVDVYTQSEPLTKCLGITKDYYYPVAEILCHKAVEDGLSHIAKDALTGEVVGFIISEDLYTDAQSSQEKYNEFVKFLPIISLIESLQKEYLRDKVITEGQILYNSMIGIDSRYHNRSIGKYLINKNIDYAKNKNFSIAITESTGIISQTIFSRLGYKKILSINYEDYAYEGAKVFANITPHQKCMLMEKVI